MRGGVMNIGDLVTGVEGVNSEGSGVVVEIKPPRGKQKTDRMVVMVSEGRVVETRFSYNLWEVVNENR
jgi:hypothetical protein